MRQRWFRVSKRAAWLCFSRLTGWRMAHGSGFAELKMPPGTGKIAEPGPPSSQPAAGPRRSLRRRLIFALPVIVALLLLLLVARGALDVMVGAPLHGVRFPDGAARSNLLDPHFRATTASLAPVDM